MFAKLWNDEAGNIALEYLLLATVVGIALVVGFSNLATALNVEYTELSNALEAELTKLRRFMILSPAN